MNPNARHRTLSRMDCPRDQALYNELFDDGMETVQTVFIHVDMAPSLFDMRPAGATTERSTCHKTRPIAYRSWQGLSRIEPRSMTDH